MSLLSTLAAILVAVLSVAAAAAVVVAVVLLAIGWVVLLALERLLGLRN